MFVITGATGNVGRALVTEPVGRVLPVRAITRRPAAADLPADVQVLEGSAADAAGLRVALRGATGLFVNPLEPALTGPAAITPRERVEVLRDVLGRDLDLEAWSVERFRAANAEIPEDELDHQMALTGSPTGDERHPTSVIEDLLGRPARTFRQWAVANADRLLPPAGSPTTPYRRAPPSTGRGGDDGAQPS